MRLILKVAALAAAAIGFCGIAAPASAQFSNRTWISATGDDANPCNRTTPCKTFFAAIARTAAGGEINCLDAGGFGTISITKSVSIICDTTIGGVMAANATGIIINSPTAVVVLSGLDLEGLGASGTPGINGINILNAASVHIRNTKIRGFRGGYGINVQSQGGNTALFVDNVTISESGSSGVAASGGINLNPAAGYTATATITNTQVVNNLNAGLRADTTGIAGSVINATLSNVTLSGNGSGIQVKAPNGAGTVKLMLTDSLLTNNSAFGIIASGAPASANGWIGNTTITNNGAGVLVLGSAVLLSYGDNRLDGNNTDGAFSGVIAKH